MRTATRHTQLNLNVGILIKIYCDIKKTNKKHGKQKGVYNVGLPNGYLHTFTTLTPDSIPALTAAQFTPGARL